MKKVLTIGLMTIFAIIGTVIAKSVVAPPEFVPYQPSESQLTKIVLIRYAPGRAALPACDNDGMCEKRENSKNCPSDCPTLPPPPPEPPACYDFLSGSKPKWNWLEDYYYEPGLESASNWATETWNAATLATIFGTGNTGTYPWGSYDYVNAIRYGDYPEDGVIAVTAIWYRGKNIYEYDIMFDMDYFPGSIDLDTVALHEFGHAAGLGDLYDTECSYEVMYGYYTGMKHYLLQGDLAGIQLLYGT